MSLCTSIYVYDNLLKGKPNDMGVIHKIIRRIKIKRICKLNGGWCPDCIYHEWVWEGMLFRGVKCRLEDKG